MQPLNIGIVGCGVIAPTHAAAYQALPDARLQWACDLRPDRARALAERFDIPRTETDLEVLLADETLDAVSVCTDHASHAAICSAALAAGKHVLCEKALAATGEQLEGMIQAGRRHRDRIFAGVFQHRFNRVYPLLKTRIEQGLLGQVLTAGVRMHCFRSDSYYTGDAWRGTWAGEGGSVLINQAIHMIDILAWILGGVEQVCATYENRTHTASIETEDTAVAICRYANRTLGTLKATCSSHMRWNPVISIQGTEGSIELREGKIRSLQMRDEQAAARLRQEIDQADAPRPDAPGKDYYGGGHLAQIADFVEAIRDDRPPFVPAEQARHAVDIVLGIYHSHRTGQWVSLPAPATSND
jgi:predicted dehydrogenase